jgi:hypothetical protein
MQRTRATNAWPDMGTDTWYYFWTWQAKQQRIVEEPPNLLSMIILQRIAWLLREKVLYSTVVLNTLARIGDFADCHFFAHLP